MNGKKGQPIKNGNGLITKMKTQMGLSPVKIYFVIWKFAPELLPNKNIKTFQELANTYAVFKDGTTEENCNAWLVLDEKVQRAAKWLVGRLHQQRIIELYEKYYQDAKNGDVKAFNAIVKFSKEYFVEDDVDELSAFLRGIKVPDNGVDEDEVDTDED